MKIKNTYKSKISEKKVSEDIFYASINNFTLNTDTISKDINKRFVQFYFCIKGSVTFHFNKNYSKVLEEGGSFMIYNPEKSLPLQISVSSKSKFNILAISILELHKLFASDALQNFFIDAKTRLYEEHIIPNSLYNLFSQLENQFINKSFKKLYLENKITEILLLYFSSRLELDVSCPFLSNEIMAKKIKKAKDLIIENYSRSIKINDLADELDISAYKLKEGFRQIYGSSISQFLLQHKMQVGKNMIERNNMKIKQIAKEVGYENPSHFIEAYKKTYGTTPKQYQKSLLN